MINTKQQIAVASLILLGAAWTFFGAFILGTSVLSSKIQFAETLAWASGLTVVSIGVMSAIIGFTWLSGKVEEYGRWSSVRRNVLDRVNKLGIQELEMYSASLKLQELNSEIEEKKKELEHLERREERRND